MKYFLILLCPMMAVLLLQACMRMDNYDPGTTVCLFMYRLSWREDSIKTTKEAPWTKLKNGNLFSWSTGTGASSISATYRNVTNIKTDFLVTPKDSVFALRLEKAGNDRFFCEASADSVYFLDRNDNPRTDIKGRITVSTDTSLVLINKPKAIMIKYKLESSK